MVGLNMFGKNKKEKKQEEFGAELFEKPFGDNALDSVEPQHELPLKEEAAVIAELPLTHSALGLYKNDTTGTWFVARFEFNPETKQVRYVDSKESADGTKGVAMEQFRISTSREIFNK